MIITEIMAAPPSANWNREWFEVYVVDPFDLDDCELRQGTTDDAEAAEDREQISGVGTPSAGEYLLFARHDYVVGDGTGGSDVPANFEYDYTTFSFVNDEPFYLFIVCGTTVVDRMEMDWRVFDDLCPDNGCSPQLAPDLGADPIYDYTANDDAESTSWCLPSDEHEFVNNAGDLCYGTPGAQNECTERNWPAEGEVVFTELMIAPAETDEWFELTSVADGERDLAMCSLVKIKGIDTDDPEDFDFDDYDVYTFPPSPSITLAADQVQVFAKDECIPVDGGGDDDSAAGADECAYDEVIYGTVSFTNGDEEYLGLVCPSTSAGYVLVDMISYDADAQGLRDGHSMQFEISDKAAAADDNDLPIHWCESAFSQCFYDPDGVNCNYGTPGEPGDCASDEVDWPDNGPACRCVLAREGVLPVSGAATLGALVLLLAALRRRP